jgi:EpsD family peptidyl-prolyl cis-trans isomerase
MKTFSFTPGKNSHHIHSLSLVALLTVAAVLTGCGDKEKAPSTQVAAKVNSDEITISQVNNALASVQATPGKTAEEAKQEVLNNLIVQNLAVQQAIKAKLDRNPAVMQAIESSKNMILARAYMDPIISGIAKPTPEDIHKFYTEHPELFSDRRIYTIRELEIESKPEVKETVIEMVNSGKNEDAIEAWAKSKDIKTSVQNGVKSSEQLPLDMLAKMAKLEPGKMMLVDMGKSVSVLSIINSKSEPVAEAAATNAIQEFLNNTHKKEALENEIKNLKTGAKIEFFGEFQAAAKGTADVKPAEAAQPAKASDASKASDMAKGLTGLK